MILDAHADGVDENRQEHRPLEVLAVDADLDTVPNASRTAFTYAERKSYI